VLNRNAKVAAICAGVVVGMVGLAYASVPLYRMFCNATGFNGATLRAVAPSTHVLERTVRVRFDANVAPGLNWDFVPAQTTTELKVGENALVFYRATNHSTTAQVGTATFNVTPEQAGAFFNKIQCFCFTEQRLEPGETAELPVSFYVDPALVDDADGKYIRAITLSYTFHPVAAPKSSAAVSAPARAGGGEQGKDGPRG
jgi:cytochrome c oxidase assembly protein subunit 11